MNPRPNRKDEGRKAVRDRQAREQYEAAKESQRREDEAKRKAAEKKRGGK